MLSRLSLVPSLLSSPVLPRDFSDFPHMHPSHVEQTDEAVNIDLTIPGFREDEVQVNVEGNLLKVKAEHENRGGNEERDSKGNIVRRTKNYASSSVMESFRLPSGLNASGMTKEIQNGVLKISIPRLAIMQKPQQQQLQQQQQQQEPMGSIQQQPAGLQGAQQLMWPPNVTMHESRDARSITYTVPLPGIRKEDIHVNVAHSNLYLTVVDHSGGHDQSTCDSCLSHKQRAEELRQSHSDLHSFHRGLQAEGEVHTADCASCAAHQSELQGLRRRAQEMEDAHAGKDIDPQHCISCAAMKGEILHHIEEDKFLHDMHGGRCEAYQRRSAMGEQFKEADQRYQKASTDFQNSQCTKFTERSVVIRLPYGTSAENINAKFENGSLTFNIERRHHTTTVPLK